MSSSSEHLELVISTAKADVCQVTWKKVRSKTMRIKYLTVLSKSTLIC